MTSFSAEQVPWAEQQDYVLSAKLTAITLLVVVALWLLLLHVLKILGLSECDAGTIIMKLTRKVKGELDALVKKLEREWELKGADLFAPLPRTEDCAICMVPLSHNYDETGYQACCGKRITCWACVQSIDSTCPFCREPIPICLDDVYTAQLQARCLQNDHNAFTQLGIMYWQGLLVSKDFLKGLDCFIRAVELGSPEACSFIGAIYKEGNGVRTVAVDKERAALFYRIGALRGCILARNLIGFSEYFDLGNHEIAIRHWKIAAEAGHQDSLNLLKKIYNADGKIPGKEFVSKECLESTYRACHEAQMEVWSEEREKHRNRTSS